MKSLLDINVWLPLVWDGHAASTVARDWLQTHHAGLTFCRVTQLALLRYLTNPSILDVDALSNRAASTLVGSLCRQSNVILAEEPANLNRLFPQLGEARNSDRNRWTDAYLAAFAITGDYEFVTFDKGFTRFKSSGLRLRLLKSHS